MALKGEISSNAMEESYSEWSGFFGMRQHQQNLYLLRTYLEVIMNGVNMTEVIDTGSLLAIMSLKKAIHILAWRQ